MRRKENARALNIFIIYFAMMILCLSGCKNTTEGEIEDSTEQKISVEQEKIIADIQLIKQTILSSPCSKDYHHDNFDVLIDEIETGKIDREICYQRIREISLCAFEYMDKTG